MGKTIRFFSIEDDKTKAETQRSEPLLEIKYEFPGGDCGIEYLSPLEAKEFKKEILFSGGRILSFSRIM
ncbi:MAG: hypothetical protein AMQ22_00228 [Candidatus Methanofastidiosum methylothiophilum]|uniref:Uncharacterized protein n=1 Tax=Candidatus Methanofastidiosum methylothiophilum TaxID=1705564 RepID=A0A150IS90_9EURY|nr:MAG: hypothetical protein APG11_00815 [Candidatus Methanofastidiosum methylthiophilus]KYC53557.1 MAG: hypothetical protein AMQ22_00228 [Candidatus Methanofastidiosum methylthiophilus]